MVKQSLMSISGSISGKYVLAPRLLLTATCFSEFKD